MNIVGNGIFAFDRQYPLYNFFYPSSGRSVDSAQLENLFVSANSVAKKRALYFHIPFCDTICSFCPFARGLVKDRSVIDSYVSALISELIAKANKYPVGSVPINAIFFGGRTPSILSPDHIRTIGKAIREYFDLSDIEEFSFEIEVKSLTKDKIDAMKEIGVTHPRFGLQTFSSKWRELFTLTATLEEISNAIELLKHNFNTVSFDLLYGMSGQDEAELLKDLTVACDTGCSNIDIYPIDNVMTQTSLHKSLLDLQCEPTSAVRKFTMNLLVDEYMRSRGYAPHNGHGYRKTDVYDRDKVIYEGYTFQYHEHVYGYHDYDLLGFGVNAISSMFGMTIQNPTSRSRYIEAYTKTKEIVVKARTHPEVLDYARPLILRLPYHGSADKARIAFNKIPDVLLERIEQLVGIGLIRDESTHYRITKAGWYNYVNMMYFLMTQTERQCLDNIVATQLETPDRFISTREIVYGDEYFT